MNDNFLIKRGHFTPLAILFMILLPLVTALICICLGRMNVPVGDVITVFRDVFTGNEGHAQNYSIVINLRLPRILMAIIVGAGLTCAGNTFQSLFSNPLATPDILGVTSGTCVGAILAIILSCGILETQLIALAFGLASVFFTLKIAGKNENRSMVYLVLAGVIASSLFNAIGSLLKYTADPQDKLPEITYWLMGSFAGASWENLRVLFPIVIFAFLFFWSQYRNLNLMLLGDEVSITLGTDLHRLRQLYLLVSAAVVGFVVYSSGTIGFVGLIIPHLVRMLFGTDHKKLLPICALVGGIFLIWADVLCRVIIPGMELPVGILTSMIGAPCFIYLMVRRRYGFGGAKE